MGSIAKLNHDILHSFLNKRLPSLTVPRYYLEANNLYEYYTVLQRRPDKTYRQKMVELPRLIRILNDLEEQTGVPYLSIKSFPTYPFLDDDLDIVVLDEGFKTYTEKLEQLGFYHLPSYADLREPLKRMYAHHLYSIRIHLHREISWNGIVCFDKQEVFNATVTKCLDKELIRVPSDTDGLSILIAHFLFENYYFKMGDILEIANLLNKPIDFMRLLRTAQSYGYKKGVYLFFSYLSGLSELYALDLKIPKDFSRPVAVKANTVFPFYISYYNLIPIYWENFYNGIKRKQFTSFFRRLITYTVVGYLWKYLIPIKKQGKLKKLLSLYLD